MRYRPPAHRWLADLARGDINDAVRWALRRERGGRRLSRAAVRSILEGAVARLAEEERREDQAERERKAAAARAGGG